MSDYISREVLMQKFADHVRRSNNSDFAPTPTWNEAVDIVEHFPDADVVERKHGKWIDCKGSNGRDYRKCSECLHTQDITGLLNFCPNCGADMRGDDDV